MDAEKCLENALQLIIEKEGLTNPQIEYEEVINPGYMSDVKMINIKHDDLVLSLVLKRLPNSPSIIKKLSFENETNFYQNVVCALKKLDAGISSFVPKCYYADSQLIILENLQTSGMKVWGDLKILLDEKHVGIVMEHYGKFHALSTALKLRFPKQFYGFTKKFDVLKLELLQLEPKNFITSVGRKAATAFNHKERKYADALMAFVKDKLYDFFTNMFDDKKHDVLVHGDCWPHNFFFKYEDSKISKMCLIDFQLSYQASPIIDLSYFLCTSGCTKKHFDSVDKNLKLYHDSFYNEMKKLGFRSEEIIPFDTLRDQWRKHGKYGLIFGMVLNKMLVADKDELAANQNEEVLMSFNFISRNEDLYYRRMRDCIMYFYDNGML